MSSASSGDSREHLERVAQPARGPKGDQGEPGKRGEQGLPPVTRRSVVILFLIAVALGAFNLFWTSHSVDVPAAAAQRLIRAEQLQAAAEQAKWCSLIVTLDQANKAAPKKPAPGTFTSAFVGEIAALRTSLGCGGAKP